MFDLFTGKLRNEMKERVDTILKAEEEWSRTAKDLIVALDKLTKAVENGNVDASTIKPVTKGVTGLTRSTKLLSKGFSSHANTLSKILGKM